jgi:hypothetical protein
MSHPKYRRKLTLFYEGLEYRFLWVNSVKEATEWMRKETQLMPYSKRHLYYFTIEARQKRCRNLNQEQKNSD